MSGDYVLGLDCLNLIPLFLPFIPFLKQHFPLQFQAIILGLQLEADW
jgi:hypothetical protein